MTILVPFISLKCEQLYQIVHVKDDLSDNLHEHQSTKVLSGEKHQAFYNFIFHFFISVSLFSYMGYVSKQKGVMRDAIVSVAVIYKEVPGLNTSSNNWFASALD